MRTIDAIVEILKREGVEYLSCFPTTPVIEAAAAAGIRPIICRQERVGVGIADGFSRVTNGERMGVFAMQYGPGAENAYSGVATSYSDSVPILFLPLGHPTDKQGILPHFDSMRNYQGVNKYIEQLNLPNRTSQVMRRAFAALRQGRPGPVMVEIPADIALQQADPHSGQSLRRGSGGPSPVPGQVPGYSRRTRSAVRRRDGPTGRTGGVAPSSGDDHLARQERFS